MHYFDGWSGISQLLYSLKTSVSHNVVVDKREDLSAPQPKNVVRLANDWLGGLGNSPGWDCHIDGKFS